MSSFSIMTGTEVVAEAFVEVRAQFITNKGITCWLSQKERAIMGDKFLGSIARNVENSVAGVKSTIGGSWFMETFDFADGALLLLSVKKRTRWNQVVQSENMVVRIRAAGPLLRVWTPTMQLASRSRFQEVTLTGRADVLTLTQLRNELIVPVPRGLEAKLLGNKPGVSLWNVETMRPETAPVPQIIAKEVTSAEGAVAVVRMQRRRRSLGL